MSDEEVLARVHASTGRRFLGIGSLWFLALLLIYVAFFKPPALGWQVFLVLLGGGALWLAERMRKATSLSLELTATTLRDSSGDVLAYTDQIESMDRGMFAFKPSNGFLLKTNEKAPNAWRPGLWWRTGRRIGVGGMTPGSQTKTMAEILSAIIAQR